MRAFFIFMVSSPLKETTQLIIIFIFLDLQPYRISQDLVQEIKITLDIFKYKRICGTYTPWNITQPLKRIHLNQF